MRRRNFFMSLQTARAKVTLDVAEVVCIFAQSRFWRRFAARFLRSGLLPASDWENRSRKTFCNLLRETSPVGIFHPGMTIRPLYSPSPTQEDDFALRHALTETERERASLSPIAMSSVAAAENKVGEGHFIKCEKRWGKQGAATACLNHI